MEENEYDYVILGAGLSGIALAKELDIDAKVVLLEQSDSPGGLVKSIQIGEFWFDKFFIYFILVIKNWSYISSRY